MHEYMDSSNALFVLFFKRESKENMKLWGREVVVDLEGVKMKERNTLYDGSGGGIGSQHQQGHCLWPQPKASVKTL